MGGEGCRVGFHFIDNQINKVGFKNSDWRLTGKFIKFDLLLVGQETAFGYNIQGFNEVVKVIRSICMGLHSSSMTNVKLCGHSTFCFLY